MKFSIGSVALITLSLFVPVNGFVVPHHHSRRQATATVSPTTTASANIKKSQLSFSLEEWVASEEGRQSIGMIKEAWKSGVSLYESVNVNVSQEVQLSVGGLLASLLGGWKLSNPKVDYRDGYEPYNRGEYDAIAGKLYYKQHPVLVLQRMLELFRLYNGFLFGVALDKYVLKKEPENREVRAQQLLEVMQKAGPTSIKVGQALSVRPDLIASEYAQALGSLQDNVPPFDSTLAMSILETEWASSQKNIQILNPKKPVASASIGQVYKGLLSLDNGDEKEVAVKVQRPNVLAEIALDLFIVKEILAPIYKRVTNSATDFASLANEWGRGFISELDYNTEAKNTIQFNQDMKDRQLDSVVMAPSVQTDFSTQRVLVTDWIDGVRLDRSDADDVSRLCGVALNAYLVMLLETGILHCDPHPGNLLRQNKDGKLVILDFGMTLETDPTLQYSLLEFVAHLTAGDYDNVPTDFVKMGFLKQERLDTVIASGFLEPLTFMFQQAKQGGGGTKVRERIFEEYRQKFPGLSDEDLRVAMRDDMQQQMAAAREKASAVSGITMEVEELQKRNKDAFTIPEWFLYTSRAFLTLEGISLSADEDYSIIQSCFPYVAKRLLKDDSPRAQQALKELLYGTASTTASTATTKDEGRDAQRWLDLADGFTKYTATTKESKSSSSSNNMLTLAKESADIVLEPSSMVQKLLLEESTLATSAQVKDTLARLPGASTLLQPFLVKTQEETKAQQLLEKILLASSSNNNNNNNNNNGELNLPELEAEQVALIVKELRENVPKYAPLVGQLGGKFATSLLEKASENIDTTLATTEEKEDFRDTLVRTAARGLSSVSKQSADVIRTTTTPQKQQQ